MRGGIGGGGREGIGGGGEGGGGRDGSKVGRGQARAATVGAEGACAMSGRGRAIEEATDTKGGLSIGRRLAG